MKWYSRYLEIYGKTMDEIPPAVISEINGKMTALQSQEPLFTVSIIAHNEETRLASCLWSLCEQKCRYPIEIIGVDNNSSDRTAQVYEKCGVKCYSQLKQSPGWARVKGLENARGKYFLNIDSDTMYPPRYIQTMADALLKDNVVGAYGLWSFYPDPKHSAFGLFWYEAVRDCYLWLLHFNKPELAVRGMVFSHRTDLARQIGIRTDIIRGEDGSLALELKKYGKLKFIRSRRARAVTGYGTMDKGGSFFQRFRKVVGMRIREIPTIFRKQDKYDDDPSNMI